MKHMIGYVNDVLSKDLHNWILLALVSLYAGLALILARQQLIGGVAPDASIMKHVGDTLIWWGGIVATAHTGKSITTTIKGKSTPPVPAQEQ